MQVPLELSARAIELDSAMEADLRRRAAKLERYYDRITSCRIAVERPTGNHHNEGGPYRVRIDITVPGSELVAAKEGEDLNATVRDAFKAAERQVEEFSQRRRGDVKTPVLPPEGQVVRVFQEEGFGFIAAPDGREVYFHRNAVLDPPGFDKIQVGSQVRFAEEQGFEGPQASTVTLIQPAEAEVETQS
ncbi:MAG TPA: HPF/RaiA family ribosome-associated protein [Thermoanaerobaculia bacterium]|nr:HPF/RaiA family ribosome-associated protein [Thermoanaerobaculia bacterium]